MAPAALLCDRFSTLSAGFSGDASTLSDAVIYELSRDDFSESIDEAAKRIFDGLCDGAWLEEVFGRDADEDAVGEVWEALERASKKAC